MDRHPLLGYPLTDAPDLSANFVVFGLVEPEEATICIEAADFDEAMTTLRESFDPGTIDGHSITKTRLSLVEADVVAMLRSPSCPDDTDGDGDCGKARCPHCGIETIRAAERRLSDRSRLSA